MSALPAFYAKLSASKRSPRPPLVVMLSLVRTLSREYLGLNRRDRDLIARYNPRRLVHLTIHKLETKAALTPLGIPVAETLAVYRFQHDLKQFAKQAEQWRDFVIKPAQGTGGDGVVVVTGRQGEGFLTLGGGPMSRRLLESHLSDILSGIFSLNHRYDEAFVERRLRAHPALEQLSFHGLPDLRVVVFRGIPLMAMLRLATRASKGRANLDAGGLGVGIDLGTGVTTGAIARRRWVSVHPDTHRRLAGVQVPAWDELLDVATSCADAIGLKYMGVDVVLDADSGPCVLELNARPGLLIQLANRRGLRPLIEAVEQRLGQKLSVRERIELGRELYGGVC